MLTINALTVYSLLAPVFIAVPAVVSRNPIHAILWLIATFLTTCGIVFYNFKLGFTCSLVIIVYVGAIAILFLFIVMMIPIKDRPAFGGSITRFLGQILVLLTAYVGGMLTLAKHLGGHTISMNSEFWAGLANQIDVQRLHDTLPTKEIEGLNLSDLYLDDIAIYGAKLYQDFAFPIVLTGILLLFVLVAAIVLCKDE